MKFFFLFFLFLVSASAQITFTEVMYDVATNEYHDEFIEIFNLSYADTIEISGWRFSDSSGVDEIIPAYDDSKLVPRSFAVILDGSYFGNSTVYDTIIPPDVLILKVSDNSLGNSGLANTRPEYLSIVDSTGDTLATYRYSIGNTPGFSDEKILIDGDNSVLNWGESLIEGGTPGKINSVSPKNIDVGLSENSLRMPNQIFENDIIHFEIIVYNFGLNAVQDSIAILLYSDRNDNDIFDSSDIQIIDQKKYVDLPVTQSIDTLNFTWNNVEAGQHKLVLQIDYNADENTLNNTIAQYISVITRQSTLHINEIKFLTFENEPEWLEIINTGDENVFLKGWGIADTGDSAYVDSSVFIYPNQLKVLSTDSISKFYDIADSLVVILDNFPTLNNSGDDISLLSQDGGWKERIVYSDDWLEGYESQNVSMERINPGLYENKSENWGPSLDPTGATPGRQNSIFTKLSEKSSKVEVSPNPFSPDGDNFEDYTIISGEIPEKSARIKIQIFDIKGRQIRRLQDNEFSGSNFNLVWDGKDSQGRVARMGIYIIFVQALNDRNGTIREMKTTVVLAHKL